MTQTATEDTTQTYNILYVTLDVSTYSARNQHHALTVQSETKAEEIAARISTQHGHASVHIPNRDDGGLLFSYAEGELMTDHR